MIAEIIHQQFLIEVPQERSVEVSQTQILAEVTIDGELLEVVVQQLTVEVTAGALLELTPSTILVELGGLNGDGITYRFGNGPPLSVFGTDGDIYEDRLTNKRYKYLLTSHGYVDQGTVAVAVLVTGESLPDLIADERGVAFAPSPEDPADFDILVSDGGA